MTGRHLYHCAVRADAGVFLPEPAGVDIIFTESLPHASYIRETRGNGNN
jgi:hypothetical protein